MTDNKKLLKWWYNKNVNPLSGKRIKQNGKVWKSFLKESLINNVMDDIYGNQDSYARM